MATLTLHPGNWAKNNQILSSFRSSCNKCSTPKGEKGESAPVRAPYQRREGRATTPNGTLLGEDNPQRIIFRPNLGQANLLCVQVLHHHPRGVDEAILALHNVGEGRHQESGGGRPQEREKGERVVLTLHPRGTGVEEAPLLLLGSGDEALMRDEDKKVLSTSERTTPLLLLLPRSN